MMDSMALNINSPLAFSSQVKPKHFLTTSGGSNQHTTFSNPSIEKKFSVQAPHLLSLNSKSVKYARWSKILRAADSSKITTEPSIKETIATTADPIGQAPSVDVSSEASDNNPPQNVATKPKKSPLTARERLRAARVLSRYTEANPKPKKPEMGKSLMEAMREGDNKNKPGLPEAPGNLFDDSKRGMPKAGLTWDLPVGGDLLVIIISFVTITTIMFATTYVVWKLGAIHFNEF